MSNTPILNDFNNNFLVIDSSQRRHKLNSWCADNTGGAQFKDPIGSYFRFDLAPKNNIDDDFSKIKNLIILFKLTFLVKELPL